MWIAPFVMMLIIHRILVRITIMYLYNVFRRWTMGAGRDNCRLAFYWASAVILDLHVVVTAGADGCSRISPRIAVIFLL